MKKTETSIDAKGYMCTQDVEVWEEVDDIKPVRKSAAAKKPAGEKIPTASAKGDQSM